jgi:hypothetical protein
MPSDSLEKNKVTRSLDGIVSSHKPTAPEAFTQQKPSRKRRMWPLWAGAGLAVAAIAVVGVVLLVNRNGNALPTAVTKQVSYPLYFPSPMPLGYIYQAGSATVSNGIINYKLVNGVGSTVVVSEQVTPPDPPILTKLAGFTSLSTDAGTAAVGTASTKQPLAIIVSNTTLITITGQANMPSDVVAKVAQAMSSLPQK